ncbi:DMT family transporter [Roseateles sp. DAIF2]|nr:DMT family transporter [Roseateles sp. DAIF2]QPF76670.1 DMT family transporter [Roseateles sp. DAIF2]
MPALFVAIWCTGFVAARLGMPHAPPIGFLALRFAISSACFGLWVWLAGAAWPTEPRQWLHLAVLGFTTHALYLIGGWAAVKQGMGAGTMALIAGLQPLLTALWLNKRGEPLRGLQWWGLLLGFAGLVLVVGGKLGAGGLNAANLALACAALAAITVGALYQKRFVKPCDARSALLIQLLAATLLSAPLAWGLEHEPMVWHRDLMLALAWSVLVLTLGGSSLLYLLLQRGAATRVTSLMYLTPPCAALLAWLLFGEPVGPLAWCGMGLSALGVFWVVRRA